MGFALSTASVQAGAFTGGNLVVVTVGDGSTALSGASAPAALYEFNPFTANQLAPVQMINLPVAASGLNQALTLSGSASSEGFLTLSGDGQYLLMAGYGAPVGTASIAGTAPTTYNRVVGRINLYGNIDTTTALTDAYNGSNIRSVASPDGVNLWTSGNAGTSLGGTAGVRYTTFGSTTSVQLNSTASNMRVVNIFNGQVYASSSTTSGGGLFGVSTIGTGLSTSGPQTPVILPGMLISGTHSSYDFWFKDASTLYVADDGSATAGGGIQKWVLNSGTWSLQYTLLNNGTSTTAVRGLAGTVDASGNAVLFATSSTTLLTVTDTGAGSTSTILATAPSNDAFRGVEIIPVPEPATAALAGLGLVIWGLFRRRS